MNEFQQVLDQIPIQQDWFSMIIFGGMVQGILICIVIAIKSKPENQPIRLFGWFILFLSLIGFDVFLCYTGLMKYVLHLNDTTEVLVILLGPFLYFYLKSLLRKEVISFKKNWIHFVLPAFHLISQMGYYFQPESVKLNGYIGAYFKDVLPFVEYPKSDFLSFSNSFRGIWRYILLFSFLLYGFLSARVIWQFRAKISNIFRPDSKINKYDFSKNFLWGFGIAFLIIFIIFLNFQNDLGDHYIALFFSLTLYLTSFLLLSESRFFSNSWIADKYETSGLNNPSNKMLQRITNFVVTEKYYLNNDASLKNLSSKMDIPANYLSQIINNQTGKNFNDFINEYRIREAQKRLIDENFAHLNIAGIGETVGFNSKSAFYAAFKKYTNQTPAAYLKSKKSV